MCKFRWLVTNYLSVKVGLGMVKQLAYRVVKCSKMSHGFLCCDQKEQCLPEQNFGTGHW